MHSGVSVASDEGERDAFLDDIGTESTYSGESNGA
ncbi:hypothetical protein J2754_001283 [Halarchaeum solikamskense]|nr:hypothetical protein [Halarchaeum solikamskense]